MSDSIYEAKLSMDSLTVYRGLLDDEVLRALYVILKDLQDEYIDINPFINHYSAFIYQLTKLDAEAALKDYVLQKLIYSDNAFSRYSEKTKFEAMSETLIKAVENDFICLNRIACITSNSIKETAHKKFNRSKFEWEMIENLPEWKQVNNTGDNDSGCVDSYMGIISKFLKSSDWKDCIKPLSEFYMHNGSGEFAFYKAFVWERNEHEGYLKGISATDPIRFSDLIGYQAEREDVINNTLAFLNGFPSNNVLLYGDRGTGKSSTVKALVNEYSHMGLRIIELPKACLPDLPLVVRITKDRPQKFILFIDDLAFSENEEEYTALKAILEGSLECRPQNVIIYATSNRRHLIKEKFSDRRGLMSDNDDDEVRAADTLQEKLSLADRFGISVTFSSPDKKRYLEIVDGLAKSRGLDVDTAALHTKALQWEMYHNGRSARTAKQFIDWICAQNMG